MEWYEAFMQIGGKTTDNIVDNIFNRKTEQEKIKAQKQINQQNNTSTERLAALIAEQNKPKEEKDNTTLYVVIAVVVVAAIVYFGWIKK